MGVLGLGLGFVLEKKERERERESGGWNEGKGAQSPTQGSIYDPELMT